MKSSSSSPVRIGIIGTGIIGQGHLREYQALPDVRIVAVADLDGAKAREVAARHPGAVAYEDYHDLLRRDDIDAVDVCLHNNLHRDATVAALKAGKHVFCEKPIAGTFADGKVMVEAAREANRMLHVQMNTLFSPAIWAAKQLVDEGRLGDLYHARAYVNLRRSRPFVDGYATPAFVRRETAGGGALIDWGIYAICPLLYLMGNPQPVRVSGHIYDRIAMDQERRASSGYDVEEMATGLVSFANGATLDLLAAWALYAPRDRGSVLAGTMGGIELPALPSGRPDKLRFFHTMGHLEVESEIGAGGGFNRFGMLTGVSDAFESSIKHWVAVLQGRVPLLPTAELALTMILIAEGLYRSHAAKREIDLREFAQVIAQ